MKWLTALPALLGSLTVLQAALNRRIAAAHGLPFAALLNSLVLASAALTVFWISGGASRLPALRELNPWYLLPGFMGITLVIGGPWSVARLGATTTFVLIVAAQLATSLFWDWKIEAISPSPARIIGVLLCWVGALVATVWR